MAFPIWTTPAGNLGIVPELEYYQFSVSASDADGGSLVYSKISGTLPTGMQFTSTGALQGVPVNTSGPDLNVTYTFTLRVTNTTTQNIADRTFSLTITNVAPPIIVPRNVNLGIYFDGAIVDLQLAAVEFIPGAALTWTLKSGELPQGLTLSSSGLISGYIYPIPASGPSGDIGWDETAWDNEYLQSNVEVQLGWDFPQGTVSKNFAWTVQVTDGVNYDVTNYQLEVFPRRSFTADNSQITVDTTLIQGLNLTIDTGARHPPIILTTETQLVAERENNYFSFQIQAIDLDGDVLEYFTSNVSSGSFDEDDSGTPIVSYVSTVVDDTGNIYAGATFVGSSNVFLTPGTHIQILNDTVTGLEWYSANVNYYSTLTLTGNTIVPSGSTLTQTASNASAVIASVGTTTGTITFGGNLVYANIGDFITQVATGANATVTATASNVNVVSVQFLSNNFNTSSNISINGTGVQSHPTKVLCNTSVGIVYNTAHAVILGIATAAANVKINGNVTYLYPSTVTSVGVTVDDAIDESLALGFDTGNFDQGVLDLPAGLILDQYSGWIYGDLPYQTVNKTINNFSIEVQKRDYPNYSASQLFSLTILGTLNNTIDWLTLPNLGTIENGAVSDLSITAISSKGKVLSYKYTPGTHFRLPQGLELTADGLISGRVSFEMFGLDKSLTTFDSGSTSFDSTYTFSVTASDYDNTVSADQVFTLQVLKRNPAPYENLYLKALTTNSQRSNFQDMMQDTSVFPPNLIYRPNDAWYGLAQDIRFLFLAGLNPSNVSTYAEAVSSNHYNKRLTFGNLQNAVVRDASYDVIDITTSNVIGTYQDNVGFIPTDFSMGYTPANSIPNGTALSTQHVKYEVIYAPVYDDNTNSLGQSPADVIDLTGTINPYTDLSGNTYSIVYPNSFGNMDDVMVANIGYANKGALPDWMTSVQLDGTQLGFTRAVVLAYTQPNASDTIIWRYNQAGYNLNDYDFTVDRYELDNVYTENYDLLSNTFITSSETTFDRYPALLNIFSLVGTVDYAINTAYDLINGRSVADINADGGLDGITYFTDGQTLVFYQQEFNRYNSADYNIGWDNVVSAWDSGEWDESSPTSLTWDEANYVPGYNEHLLNPSVINERIGIWTINIDSSNLVSLTFNQAINLFDTLYVRNGYTHGGARIFYDPLVKPENTLPNYSVIPQQIRTTYTTFDGNGTRFLNYRDSYVMPEDGDKYIKFPKLGVFT